MVESGWLSLCSRKGIGRPGGRGRQEEWEEKGLGSCGGLGKGEQKEKLCGKK